MSSNFGYRNCLFDQEEYSEISSSFQQETPSHATSSIPMHSMQPSCLRKLQQFFSRVHIFPVRKTYPASDLQQNQQHQSKQSPRKQFRKTFSRLFSAASGTKQQKKDYYHQNNNQNDIDLIEHGFVQTPDTKLEQKVELTYSQTKINEFNAQTDTNKQKGENNCMDFSDEQFQEIDNNVGCNKSNLNLKTANSMEQDFFDGGITLKEKNLHEHQQNDKKLVKSKSIVKKGDAMKVAKKVRFVLPTKEEEEECLKNWDDLSFSDESFEDEETYQTNWLVQKQHSHPPSTSRGISFLSLI